MTAIPRSRPAAVPVLGVLFILLSLLVLLEALGGIASSLALFSTGTTLPAPSPEEPPIAHQIVALLPYSWIPGLIGLPLACLALAAAVAFLRGRGWGRAAMEAFTWLGLVLYSAFTAWWMVNWLAMGEWAHRLSESDLSGPHASLVICMTSGVASMLIGLAVVSLIISALRSRRVREAMLSP